jgi:S1-C subfamily serine protease
MSAAAALLAGLGGVLVGVALADDGDDEPANDATIPAVVAADNEAASAVRQVAEAVGPSVVTISADVEGAAAVGEAVGTGVIVSPDGEILTNAHVVDGATEIRVRRAGETEPTEAELVASDEGNDLALLKIDESALPAAAFAPSSEIQLGDEVVAIGFALDLDGEPSVTLGIVSALDRTIITETGGALDGLIQTDAAISSGNSGGPLVDMRGRIVGINTAVARSDTLTAATNVGFAIAADEVQDVLADLRDRAGGDPRLEGFLGISLDDRADGGQGALITQITDDSPAAKAGLETGDVVISVDSSVTEGAAAVIAAIRDHEPGDEIHVVVVRDGEKQTFTVVLTERPEDS